MDSGRRRFTVVVGEPDDLRRSVLQHQADEAGFHVQVALSNPVETLQQVEVTEPSLLLTGYSYWGMSGLELAEAALALDQPPIVVLVLDDLAITERAHAAGCFAVTRSGDAEALEHALGDVVHFLETGERRSSADRRGTPDRRQHQDWSKVTQERRSGEDRRSGDRRDDA